MPSRPSARSTTSSTPCCATSPRRWDFRRHRSVRTGRAPTIRPHGRNCSTRGRRSHVGAPTSRQASPRRSIAPGWRRSSTRAACRCRLGFLAPFAAWRAAYARCRWIGPGRGWVDPLKERQGEVLGLDAAFGTLEESVAEMNGGDWREMIEQRAIEVQAIQGTRPEAADLGGRNGRRPGQPTKARTGIGDACRDDPKDSAWDQQCRSSSKPRPTNSTRCWISSRRGLRQDCNHCFKERLKPCRQNSTH